MIEKYDVVINIFFLWNISFAVNIKWYVELKPKYNVEKKCIKCRIEVALEGHGGSPTIRLKDLELHKQPCMWR